MQTDLHNRLSQVPAEPSLATRVNSLWVGFAGLLLLMAFSTLDAARSIQNLETESMQLRQQSRARDLLLDRLRSDLEQSGTLARDYLIEPDRHKAAQGRREMEAMRQRSDQTLNSYSVLLVSGEASSFAALSAEARDYWHSLDPILGWEPEEREQKMDDYLQDVVLPRRGEAVELAQHVIEINAADLNKDEARIQTVQRGFRQRILLVSGLALGFGLLLAIFSVRRIRRLELEAEARYIEAKEARLEMKRLADRLVIAQEEERRSISRELHDEIGQSMSAMLMDLGSVEAAMPEGNGQKQRLTNARVLAESSVRSIRDIALLLRPSMLDDLGLVPALNWQAREITRRTGLKVKLVAKEIAEDLPDQLRTCVFRIVQEALQNCVKHARASQVQVSVHQDEQGLSLSIDDDGLGFDVTREKGLGLLGIEERVAVLGGRFQLKSKKGAGTSLLISLPLVAKRT